MTFFVYLPNYLTIFVKVSDTVWLWVPKQCLFYFFLINEIKKSIVYIIIKLSIATFFVYATYSKYYFTLQQCTFLAMVRTYVELFNLWNLWLIYVIYTIIWSIHCKWSVHNIWSKQINIKSIQHFLYRFYLKKISYILSLFLFKILI